MSEVHPAVAALQRIVSETQARGGTYVQPHESQHIDYLCNQGYVQIGSQTDANGQPAVRSTPNGATALTQQLGGGGPVYSNGAPTPTDKRSIGGFAIDDGVPMPQRRTNFVRRTERPDLPFEQMQVGQSVYIPAGGAMGDEPARTYAGDVASANKRLFPKKYSLVKVEGGARLFRVEDHVGPRPERKTRGPRKAAAGPSPASGAPVTPQGWGEPLTGSQGQGWGSVAETQSDFGGGFGGSFG